MKHKMLAFGSLFTVLICIEMIWFGIRFNGLMFQTDKGVYCTDFCFIKKFRVQGYDSVFCVEKSNENRYFCGQQGDICYLSVMDADGNVTELRQLGFIPQKIKAYKSGFVIMGADTDSYVIGLYYVSTKEDYISVFAENIVPKTDFYIYGDSIAYLTYSEDDDYNILHIGDNAVDRKCINFYADDELCGFYCEDNVLIRCVSDFTPDRDLYIMDINMLECQKLLSLPKKDFGYNLKLFPLSDDISFIVLEAADPNGTSLKPSSCYFLDNDLSLNKIYYGFVPQLLMLTSEKIDYIVR